MNKIEFTIIIPCYNEENGIKITIDSLLKYLEKAGKFEIIIVDDGSTDRTPEILKQIAKRDLEIFMVNHPQNMGYGAAIKTGIKKARYDTIVITDADGTYPHEKIPDLLKLFQNEDVDMVVGARINKNVKIPLTRKPAKWCITRLASFLAGTDIPDLNSGLRVMKKNVVEKYIRLLPNGFSFTSTITLAMLTNQHHVKYLPIDYFERTGRSKIRPLYDTVNFIQLIIRMVLYFNPLKVFLPISMILFITAIAVFFYSLLFTPKIMDATVTIIVMSAIQILVIGMLADLIDKRSL